MFGLQVHRGVELYYLTDVPHLIISYVDLRIVVVVVIIIIIIIIIITDTSETRKQYYNY